MVKKLGQGDEVVLLDKMFPKDKEMDELQLKYVQMLVER